MSGHESDDIKRRTSPRIRIETEVSLEHASGTLVGSGGDINDKSMLVFTDEQLPLDTVVTLRCVDDTGSEIVVQGTVTRHQPASESQPAGLVVTERAPVTPEA